MTTPTKPQRARLFRLARLLDRVSPRKFDMRCLVVEQGSRYGRFVYGHSPKECGYAGCAIGWAQTMPEFKMMENHWNIAHELGMIDVHGFTAAGLALFGYHRNVTPRRVAADIRAYLKTGELPK